MTESFLHYLWKYRLFSKDNLFSTDGERIEVLNAGRHNTDAGPDFLDARIKIGDTLWAGHVELHFRSSSWNSHGHSGDPAYDNVVLHVVYENDRKIPGNKSGSLPALELKDRFDPRLWDNYQELVSSLQWISCSHRLKEVPPLTVTAWLDTLLLERLQSKTAMVARLLEENGYDWEESFYQRLAFTFGLKVNADTFFSLARSLPLQVIRKHRDSQLQVEALFYGQAGMLQPKMKDPYARDLYREYRFLRAKFKLIPVAYASWKFLRLRPSSFPTVRLAQLAAFMHDHPDFFSRILEAKKYETLQSLFVGNVSSFWKNHYRFSTESAPVEKGIGRDFFHSLLVNTVLPFLFAYGQFKQEEDKCERALRFMEEIPPEDNKVIRKWREHGIDPVHAGQSQALLQLKTCYCEPKNCVNCSIGKTLISKMP